MFRLVLLRWPPTRPESDQLAPMAIAVSTTGRGSANICDVGLRDTLTQLHIFCKTFVYGSFRSSEPPFLEQT